MEHILTLREDFSRKSFKIPDMLPAEMKKGRKTKNIDYVKEIEKQNGRSKDH